MQTTVEAAAQAVQHFEETALAFAAREGLFAPDIRVIAACSGGAYSMALLLFLYRAAYYNSTSGGGGEQADENVAECIVAKNRHGEVDTVRLGWDGAHTRFLDVDFSHEN